MKRFFAFVISMALCFSLVSCGVARELMNKETEEKKTPDEIAFEESKKAYDVICSAYEITDKYSSDIYDAWMCGIYDDDELLSEGISYLADEVSLSEKELEDGLAYFIATIDGEDWDSLSDSEKEEYYYSNTAIVFKVLEDSLFSVCIGIINSAYKLNGSEAAVEKSLDEAKEIMKELSASYSDYEHYPNLKGFYTTTRSFFEYCQDPEGSFEQSKTTINDYRNEIRDFKSDLDYIFED